jgi:hypothetical protein
MRGINLASKKRPLLGQWFRTEPLRLIEVDVHAKRNHQGEVIEIETVDVQDLERKWKPTAAVATSIKAGMPEYMHDGPIEDEKAIKDAIKERKRQKLERQ